MAKQLFIINKIDDKHKCIKSNYGHLKVKYSIGCCTLCNDWEHRLFHPLSQHSWDMFLDILLMWWKFNFITLPHHKMLQPWAFNIHKECHGKAYKKNLPYFHCAIGIRCLSCRVEHDKTHSLKNLDLDNNTRIIVDEKNPSKRGVI